MRNKKFSIYYLTTQTAESILYLVHHSAGWKQSVVRRFILT